MTNRKVVTFAAGILAGVLVALIGPRLLERHIAQNGHAAHQHDDFAPVALAQETGGTPVTFKGAGREVRGVLFRPKGNGPFPAVIDIHGINGQTEWDFVTGRRLAEAGYVVLAVDLFGRPSRNYEDGLLQRDRFRPTVQEDLKGAVTFLTQQPFVVPTRIGSVGWCMGGGYSLLLAVADPRLAAAVVYYGPVEPPPGPPTEELRNIKAPMIAHFGLEDYSIAITSVKMWANNMKAFGKPLDLHLYPGAGHGFAERQNRTPTHGEKNEPGPAELSWERTMAFLDKHLKGGKS
jgi:carboxymethylenebutenolidase